MINHLKLLLFQNNAGYKQGFASIVYTFFHKSIIFDITRAVTTTIKLNQQLAD